mmetsp:Transcript_99884/g.278137  ORF Transcript_99884/g.278137 Transcript_99884/m.278137 type:complete len:357 (+) Transcript_99884:85-1155(+)
MAGCTTHVLIFSHRCKGTPFKLFPNNLPNRACLPVQGKLEDVNARGIPVILDLRAVPACEIVSSVTCSRARLPFQSKLEGCTVRTACIIIGYGEGRSAHQLDKLIFSLGEQRVKDPLFVHCGDIPTFAVVAGEHLGVPRKCQQALVHTAVELPCIAPLEVGCSAAADQEGVPREDGARSTWPFEQEGHTAARVPWRSQDLQRVQSKAHDIAVLHQDIPPSSRGPGGQRLRRWTGATDLRTGCATASVAMGAENVLELEAQLLQVVQVAVPLLGHGIDQHCLAHALACQQVGEGRAPGIGELLQPEPVLWPSSAQRRRCLPSCRQLLEGPVAQGPAGLAASREGLQVQVCSQLLGRC